jgi:tRNA (guanine26-N2/guanine27-N2)-dimethyltransferase
MRLLFPYPTETVVEGFATLTVPKLSLYAKGPSEYIPSKTPVFYNPIMKLNRDIAILALTGFQRRVNRGLRVCEPLAGCGVRGIRFALEVDGTSHLVLNDINPQAVKLVRHNCVRNRVAECAPIRNLDANTLLNLFASPQRRFDAIDIDPYGSPSLFLDSAIRALRNGGLLAVTATDTATLCGAYPDACLRRYDGKPLRTEYCHELAVRLLISSIAVTAGKYRFGVGVLLSHSSDHYVRVYVQLRLKAAAVKTALQNRGYVLHCFHCLNRGWSLGVTNFPDRQCVRCGATMSVAGPLWLGRLVDRKFCRAMIDDVEKKRTGDWRRAERLLDALSREADSPPTYLVIDRICRKLRLPPPPKREVMMRLRERGYVATPTHFHHGGVKTTAPLQLVEKTVVEIVHDRR